MVQSISGSTNVLYTGDEKVSSSIFGVRGKLEPSNVDGLRDLTYVVIASTVFILYIPTKVLLTPIHSSTQNDKSVEGVKQSEMIHTIDIAYASNVRYCASQYNISKPDLIANVNDINATTR